MHIAHRNALVGFTKEAERGAGQLIGAIKQRALAAEVARHASVEADDAGQAKMRVGAGNEREGAAHAEADGEGWPAAAIARAQVSQRGVDIGEESLLLYLLHMWHVLERVVARGQTGGTAKIINRHRFGAGFGETQRQVFVELVQPAHIGKDHYLRSRGMLRMRSIRREAIAVRGRQYDIFAACAAVGARRHRRTCIVIVTHSVMLSFSKILYGFFTSESIVSKMSIV